MVVRLVLSLAFIALVLWFAARVAQKRGLGQGNGLIEVVARQRMGRASTVSVVRIAGRVLVVGATAVVRMSLASWNSRPRARNRPSVRRTGTNAAVPRRDSPAWTKRTNAHSAPMMITAAPQASTIMTRTATVSLSSSSTLRHHPGPAQA